MRGLDAITTARRRLSREDLVVVLTCWIGTNALASVSDVSTRALFSETEVRIGGISDKLARSEAIRVGDKKLIETANGAQCYDLATDPRERHPLAFDHDCMSDLQQQLSTFRVRSAALAARFGESPPGELSPDLLRGLQTLGYVSDAVLKT